MKKQWLEEVESLDQGHPVAWSPSKYIYLANKGLETSAVKSSSSEWFYYSSASQPYICSIKLSPHSLGFNIVTCIPLLSPEEWCSLRHKIPSKFHVNSPGEPGSAGWGRTTTWLSAAGGSKPAEQCLRSWVDSLGRLVLALIRGCRSSCMSVISTLGVQGWLRGQSVGGGWVLAV